MYCKNCGKKIKAGSCFCPECGAGQENTGTGAAPDVSARDIQAGQGASAARSASTPKRAKRGLRVQSYPCVTLIALVVMFVVGMGLQILMFMR